MFFLNFVISLLLILSCIFNIAEHLRLQTRGYEKGYIWTLPCAAQTCIFSLQVNNQSLMRLLQISSFNPKLKYTTKFTLICFNWLLFNH